jgi:hypothetical protein
MFLDPAYQLNATTLDDIQIVICELAPLLLRLAAELIPIALDSIPIHRSAPFAGQGRDESVNKRLNAFRIDNIIAKSGTDTAIKDASQRRRGTSRAFGNACKYLLEF